MMDGVVIHPLTAHVDERGYLMELLHETDPFFRHFAQVYVSKSYPGVIRGWHWHEKQTDIWVVVGGNIRAGLHDRRPESPTAGETRSVFLGEDNRVALVIPPGVAHGFKAYGDRPALLLNFTDRPYDPADEMRIRYDDPSIGFNWDLEFT